VAMLAAGSFLVTMARQNQRWEVPLVGWHKVN
jgi:hypothetical protein